MNKDQRIRCPIHDLISFKKGNRDDEMLWLLLNSKPVQRLRGIKQLGFSEFVYPGATHSRLAHSIGAMQMARRMLDVLARDLQIDQAAKWRSSTLAAALLHDIGHGPYSHVFEELSREYRKDKHHESYTSELIEFTNLKDVLSDFGIYESTLAFFKQEPTSLAYGSVISSQIDCDRLDFLCRDRYQVGLRSGAIDLEWLFDSLAIEEVSFGILGDGLEYKFVFKAKGLSVAEEFVHSYIMMYKSVYFHKTTRGVQHLVAEALRLLLAEERDGKVESLPLVRFLRGEGGLEEYLCLDDASLISVLRAAASGEYGRATQFAERFFCRQPLKAYSVPSSLNGTRELGEFKRRLDDKKIWYKIDVLSSKGFKQYDVTSDAFLQNIMIKYGARPVPLAQVSNIFKVAVASEVRFYFECGDARDRATELLKQLRRDAVEAA